MRKTVILRNSPQSPPYFPPFDTPKIQLSSTKVFDSHGHYLFIILMLYFKLGQDRLNRIPPPQKKGTDHRMNKPSAAAATESQTEPSKRTIEIPAVRHLTGKVVNEGYASGFRNRLLRTPFINAGYALSSFFSLLHLVFRCS
jgi:hypothetical protein